MLDWEKYIVIGERFQHKAKAQDREDLKHTIILKLAQVASNNGHKPPYQVRGRLLTEATMCRIASYIPSVIVLWGSRSAQVRIFTDYLVAVREQEYQGYWHYLLDFRNGFWESSIDKGISEIVGVFTDPILVFPGGWGDTLPEWLKGAITMERMIENMKALKDEEMTGTDAEACAYLMTVSLTQPMDNDWTQIYLYVTTQTYKRWGKSELPSDIAVDSISNNQLRELNRLKAWLYRQRTKIRLEREQAERRERKEEEIAKRKAEQPALFEF